MSENALPLGNILNSLMEHPEMLQKAMSIAGSLASSGVLDNLMNTPTDGGGQTASANAYSTPQNGSPDLASVGNLLAGLMKGNGAGEGKGDEARTREEYRSSAQSMNSRPDSASHGEDRAFSENFSNDKQAQLPHNQASHHQNPHVGHTERIRLLQSLRPFLPCDKQEKIDFVIKLLGLLEAAERMGLGKLF